MSEVGTLKAKFNSCFAGRDGYKITCKVDKWNSQYYESRFGQVAGVSLAALGHDLRIALKVCFTDNSYICQMFRRSELGGFKLHDRVMGWKVPGRVDWDRVSGAIDAFVTEYADYEYSVAFRDFRPSLLCHSTPKVAIIQSCPVLKYMYVAGPVSVNGSVVGGIVKATDPITSPSYKWTYGSLYVSDYVGSYSDDAMFGCIGVKNNNADVAFVTDGEKYCHMTHPSRTRKKHLVLVEDDGEPQFTTADKAMIHEAIKAHLGI